MQPPKTKFTGPECASAVIGLLLIVLGLVNGAAHVRLKMSGARTIAKFVRYDEVKEGKSKRIQYRPVFSFTTAEGQAIEAPAAFYLADTSFYQVGQEVPMLYHPKFPQRATIDAFGSLFGGSIGLASIGAMFFGAAAFSRKKRHAKRLASLP